MEGFIAELSTQFWLVCAVFVRIGPAIYLAPGYGESYVSVRVRLSIAGFFSVAIAPVLAPYISDATQIRAELLEFLLRESTIGFFIGLMSRGMIYLLEKAGAIISQSISLSQMNSNSIFGLLGRPDALFVRGKLQSCLANYGVIDRVLRIQSDGTY
jgi:flagellar biosynthetic protein FliR